MDIRKKTLLALAITFIVLFSLIAGVSVFLYVDQLGRLEQQQVTKDVTEVINAISNEQDDLKNTLHDWSYWDDTYNFALDRNQDYITQNLNETSLASLRVHLFVVTDNEGRIIYGKTVDPVTGRESPLPGTFREFLPPGHPFLNQTSLSGTNTGILLLPEGPLMVASATILNSRNEGPTHGLLVMGRALDEQAFSRISRVTGNPISAYANGGFTQDPLKSSILQKMNPDSTIVSIPRPDGIISGYTVIHDVNSRKILIETDQPRDLYLNGLSIIQTYLALFTFAIAVTLVIVLVVVDRAILKRLNLLTNRVRKMRPGDNDDMQPELTGNDEIALLEREILSAHAGLRNSEQKLNTFINAVSDPSLLMKPDGTIIMANPALARVFGQSHEKIMGTNIRAWFPAQETEKKLVQEVIRDKKIMQQEILFAGKNYLATLYPVIGLDGNVEQIALLTIDVTDLKRVETSLQRATKKINLLNMIIFNDIQNQVFIQLGYSRVIEDLISDPKILAYLKKEESAAKEIQASLDFAQEYQTMGTNPPVWQNVSEVMALALSQIDLSSIARDFQLKDLEIYADPLLERLFLKIIKNTTIHGKGATQIRAGYRETGDGLILFIEDDGPGIAADRKEQIFTKNLGAGTANSLFLAREILSVTGITITENGEPGRGARFEIFVPRESYRFMRI